MVFPENYYQLHEIFKIEESGQQCFVVAPPIRKADNRWSVMVRLVDDDYSSVLDVDACHIGGLTRWVGNAKPELNDCGENIKILLVLLTLPQSIIKTL